MTALPLSPTKTRARSAERRRLPWRRVLAGLLPALVLLAAVGARALAQEPIKGEFSVSNEDGFARLVFRFEKEVPANVRVNFPIMVVTFQKPVAISVGRLNAGASDFISAARVDPDGTAIRIALTHNVKFHTIAAAERFYLDLLPENWTGVMPGLPQQVVEELANRALEAERQLRQQRLGAKPQKRPLIRVKVATQPTFTRYVFTMPEMANVVPERGDGKLSLEFDEPIRWDLADARAAMPKTLKSIASDVEYDSVTVTFAFNGTPKVRTFREDRSIVVDVGHDDAAPDAPKVAAKPDAATKPASGAALAIEPPQTVPAKEGVKETVDAPPAKTEPAPPKLEVAAPPAPPAPTTPPPPAKAADATPAPLPAAKPAAAEHKRPAPRADAPVVVELRHAGNTLRAEFPFVTETPAAVFQRADTLWLVFDNAAKIDLAAFKNDASHIIRAAMQERGADGEAIVRLRLERPRLVSLNADGPGWIVTLADAITTPSRPLTIARSIVGKNRASIAIPFAHPRKLHVLADRAIGDRLMVITALGPARGFVKGQNFVELRALPSTHGVVLQPLADDVSAELAVDKITITRPGGLSLSPTVLAPQPMAGGVRALTFDTQLWSYDKEANFTKRQDELIRIAAMAPASKRKQARLNLARFYLARDMAAEAKAVLDVTLADKKGGEDITGNVLRAVADLGLARPKDALKELSTPPIGNQLDAPIWRAIADARLAKWAPAHDAFKAVDHAISALPLEYQRMALQAALHAAIEVHDFAGADRIVNELDTIGVSPEMEPEMAVLNGRLDEALGRNEDALANYHTAAASRDRRAAAQGRLREIVLRYSIGEMPRKDVIAGLELLTTIWRGDDVEAEGLKLLAHLYTEDGRYRDAFHVMRTALLVHPNSELTRQIQDEAAVTFDSLFLGGKGDGLPPIEALGLFYDFRDLTPIGRRGDEMIRRLADRLVAVDLLDQAAELLQHQVDHRLQGGARAQVATRLAVIYLMNHKPERALATLQATRTAELSNDLRDQRLLLEARALSETGRHDLALELIANIDSREAIRLRSDILWAAKRWRDAAEQIEILYGERWRDFTPLTETERFDILRAAIGYSLGEESIGLARFRERYAAKMANTPDGRAFDIVSAPTGNAGAEFQDIAKKIAAVNSLGTFLRELSKRYPNAAAITLAAAAKAAPAAAPAGTPAKAPAKPAGPSSQAAAPEKAADNAPGKPAAAPPASKPPAPAKADAAPTGSIWQR
jgi:hypothetical protein